MRRARPNVMPNHNGQLNTAAWWALAGPETRTKAADLLREVSSLREAGTVIYPPQECILRALSLVDPNALKVVILGQDPYHESGQANGLAFSVNPGVRLPPSLRNICKELSADIGCDIPVSGDLTAWARQGVLLLNTVLTVEEGKANSHRDLGWQQITQSILRACGRLPQPVVFLAWGKQAVALAEDAIGHGTGARRKLIASTHPSPLSATRAAKDLPAFIGSRPFSQANAFLASEGVQPINWAI